VGGGWKRLHEREGDQVDEDETGETCSTHGGDEKFIPSVSRKT